jgi:hypothetical protein
LTVLALVLCFAVAQASPPEGVVQSANLGVPAKLSARDAPMSPLRFPPREAAPLPKVAREGWRYALPTAIALAGAAVIAAASSVILLVVASGERSRLYRAIEPDGLHIQLTQADAFALRDSANAKYTGALMLAMLATALTAAALGFVVF